MKNKERIAEWVQLYLAHVRKVSVDTHVRVEEGYKFKAVQHFQSHFDLEAPDLAGNLTTAILDNNLSIGAMWYPRVMLVRYAQQFPNETRELLRNLFDETKDVRGRITAAEADCDHLLVKRNSQAEQKYAQTFIGLRFLSLLLSYRYPDKHDALKPAEWKVFCRFMNPEFGIPKKTPPGEQYAMYCEYIEPLREYLLTRPEIAEIKKKLVEGLEFRDDAYRWMTQDVIYVTARSYAGARSAAIDPTAPVEVRDIAEVDTIEQEAASALEDGTGYMPLEKHLEEYIVRNWANIDFGEKLEIYNDEDGTPGQQYTTDVGIIDVLARDAKGDFVVIELKRAESGYNVVGQILSYMGWVQEKLAQKNQKVRGMIIVGKADGKLHSALRLVSNSIELREYQIEMKLVRPKRG